MGWEAQELESARQRIAELEEEAVRNAAVSKAALEELTLGNDGGESTSPSKESCAESVSVGELRRRLSCSNDEMLALDARFKALWHDMKAENGRLRRQLSVAQEAVASEAARRRKGAEALSTTQRRLRESEAGLQAAGLEKARLQAQLTQAREEQSLMRTIARIRNETNAPGPAGVRVRKMGFDALVSKIDDVSSEVQRQVTFSSDPTR